MATTNKTISRGNAMAIIKSILNNTISMMVTRNRVLKATRCSIEDFAEVVNSPDGIDCFIKDFRKEGWDNTELRSILDTLFHLNRTIDCYGQYWF